MSDRPLKVAVVGHTNTGKTSLMRTLLRDVDFGEVSDRPAVTREVEGAAVLVNGRAVAELYDTPGLEDSIGLLDHLDSLRPPGASQRVEGIEIIEQFLRSPEAASRFAQEAKALRQVIDSDAALYVIDARDRVLGKHHDELAILAMCARPIVPVLNFTARPEAQPAVWREQLSRAGLHAAAEFDIVVLDELGEQRLYEKMRTLLDGFRPQLDALIDDRRKQRERIIVGSAGLIADLLIDAAAHCAISSMEPDAKRDAMERLKDDIRRREQQCVEQILELHRFRRDAWTGEMLPLVEGRWGLDLFHPEAMKQFGFRAGSGAAAGAMAGLAVDLVTGGLTLGAGTATGAAIGAALSTGRSYGRRFVDRLRGRTELRCDDAALRLLAARQVALVRALLHRGHAAMKPVPYGAEGGVLAGTMPEALAQARARPEWSRLHGRDPKGWSAATTRPAREAARSEIARVLEERIRSAV
jgi:hypothetical protein